MAHIKILLQKAAAKKFKFLAVVLIFTILLTGCYIMQISPAAFAAPLMEKLGPALGNPGRGGGGEGLPILMYHHLVPEKYNDPGNPYVVTAENFEAQMDFLKGAGYTTVSLKQYFDFLNGVGTLPPKPVVITFDDGYASNYHLAYPILKEREMKAVVFVVGAWVAEDDAPYAPERLDQASWGQLKEMADSGVFEVQSHTYDAHYKVGLGSALTRRLVREGGGKESRVEFRERVLSDLKSAREVIEECLSQPVYAFAFPYGRYNEEALEMVRQAGYSVALTTKNGFNEGNVDLWTLRRVGVLNKDSLKHFKKKLKEPEGRVGLSSNEARRAPEF